MTQRREMYPKNSLSVCPLYTTGHIQMRKKIHKKRLYNVTVQRTGYCKPLSLEDLCHKHFLEKTGEFLNRFKAKIVRYPRWHNKKGDRIILISGWRKYFKPTVLTKLSNDSKLRKDLMCTKIHANTNCCAALIMRLYLAAIRKKAIKFNSAKDVRTLYRFLRRPFQGRFRLKPWTYREQRLAERKKDTLIIAVYDVTGDYPHAKNDVMYAVHFLWGHRCKMEMITTGV